MFGFFSRGKKKPEPVLETSFDELIKAIEECLLLCPNVYVYGEEVEQLRTVLVEQQRKLEDERVTKAPNAADNVAQAVQAAKDLRDLIHNLTFDGYPSVMSTMSVLLPMEKLTTHSNEITSCLGLIGITTPHYRPRIPDIEKDFQNLCRLFSDNGCQEKLEEVLKFLDARHLQRPCLRKNPTIKELLDQYQIPELSPDAISDKKDPQDHGYYVMYRGKLPKKKGLFVIKVYAESQQGEEAFRNEIIAYGTAKYAYATRFFEATSTPPYTIVSSNFTAVLRERLSQASFRGVGRTHCAYAIASILAKLHEKNFVHRGLSSECICQVNGPWEISDFGLCHKDGRQYGPEFGVENYLAPEIIKGEKYSFASDVFAFGMLLYELLTGHRCFHGEERSTVLSRIARGDRPALDNSCPDSLKDLISDCVQDDPNSRPSFPDILERMELGLIQFPDDSPEAIDKIAEYYSEQAQSRRLDNADTTDFVKRIVDIVNRVIGDVGQAILFAHELLHVRRIIETYRDLLTPFTKKRFKIDMEPRIIRQYLRNLGESLVELDSVVCSVHKRRLVDSPDPTAIPLRTTKELIQEFMERCHEAMTELGFKVEKYEPPRDAIKRDLEILLQCFSRLEEGFPGRDARLRSIIDIFDEYGLEHEEVQFSKEDATVSFELDPNDFTVDGLSLGSGATCAVFRAVNKKTGEVVAMKSLARADKKSLKRELDILANFSHPNILGFVGAHTTEPFAIFTELMTSSLFDRLHMKKGKRLTPMERTKILFGVALGMEAIHDRGFIHRDLKTQNILLDQDCNPKIGDFGLARQIDFENLMMTKGVGTAQYTAPEVQNGVFYTEKADVFSFGIVAWEILTNELPFAGVKTPAIYIRAGRLPVIPDDAPERLDELIRTCMDTNPDERPSFTEIIDAMIKEEIFFPGASSDEVTEFYELERMKRPSKPSTD